MRILIAGLSEIGRGLLNTLTSERDHEVVVVDKDQEVCEHASAEYDAIVVHGDASDPDVLGKAQLAEADAVVITTSSDAVNTVVAMLARRHQVPRIISVAHTDAIRGALEEAGVTDLIVPAKAAITQIEASLHGAEPTHVGRLLEGGLHLAEVGVGSEADGTTLGDHDLPEGTLTAAHLRGDDLQVAHPGAQLAEGDTVFVLANTEKAARDAHTLFGNGRPRRRRRG